MSSSSPAGSLSRASGRRLKPSPSTDSLNTHPLLGSTPPQGSANLAPPNTAAAQGSRARAGSGASMEGNPPGAPGPGSAAKTYTSLNYAPRQRNAPYRASQAFQSHQSLFHAQAATSSPLGPSTNSASVASDSASASSIAPVADPAAATAAAKLQLQLLKAEAQSLGLGPQSVGWAMLGRVQSAAEGEWAAIAELVGKGEATLLLPQEPLEAGSAFELSLPTVYDHVLLSAGSSRPSPSNFSGASLPGIRTLATLSGLRGEVEGDDLILKSFIPRADLSFIAELRNQGRRGELLTSLSPLPTPTVSGEDAAEVALYPTFRLGAYKGDLVLPAPGGRSRDVPALPPRSRSSSRVGSDGATPPALPPRSGSTGTSSSRASTTFASLFGGSGREKRRSQVEDPQTQGAELMPPPSLQTSVAGQDLTLGDDASASPISHPIEIPMQRAATTPELFAAPVEPKAEVAVAESPLQELPPPSSALTQMESSLAAGGRPIAVWVVDRTVRRSTVLRQIAQSIEKRIKSSLAQDGLPQPLIEVVCSFAAMFLPPLPQQAQSPITPGSVPGPRSPMHGVSVIANAPYLTEPDEMADSFQDFFASVRTQIATAQTDKSLEDAGETLDQQAEADQLDAYLERVESVVCEEVYDRIFCPSTSRDAFHDDALASRIAALNVLGLSLGHLGLETPDQSTQEGQETMQGLLEVVNACGSELQKLQSMTCRSPKAKLEVLVNAHKLVVEGLAQLPPIGLKQDATTSDAETAPEVKEGTATPEQNDSTAVDAQATAQSNAPEGPAVSETQAIEPAAPTSDAPSASALDAYHQKPAELSLFPKKPQTSSADLILPVLLFSIVTSNPPRLASNLLFIQRFRAESLVRGEASYCLVNVQAAVAFLENVDPPALGLSGTGQVLSVEDTLGHRAKVLATEIKAASALASPQGSFSMPTRIRGRVTQEIGELAGISNKVITGVLGSSISAFGRMMGAGAAAGAETWERSRADGPKTLEDVKSVLSGGSRFAPGLLKKASFGSGLREAAALPPIPRELVEVGRSRDASVKGKEDESDARSVRSVASSRSRQPTDYSREEEQTRDRLGADLGRDKMTIGDRLASIPMLGRLGISERGGQSPGPGGSPNSLTRELPGPPPPAKPASSTSFFSFSSRAARSGSYSQPVLITKTDSSEGAASSVVATSNSAAAAHIPASLQSPYPPLASPPTPERPLHIVLASTGSVASVKVPLIVEQLLEHANVRVQIIATASSLHFYDQAAVAALNGDGNNSERKEGDREDDAQGTYTIHDLAAENKAASSGTPVELEQQTDRSTRERTRTPKVHLWTDKDEWNDWAKLGDPILHIELRRWADIVLVAPCSANTLAKINSGICDSLLTSFLRALSPTTPTILFPAMNTLMYMHPLTARHMAFAREALGYEILGPIEKRLACGDLGQGAMLEWTEIVQLVVERFGLARKLELDSADSVGAVASAQS